MLARRTAWLLLLALFAACRGDPAATDPTCRCTPENRARTRLPGGEALDGAALVAKLRRHARDVALHRPARDIKVFDDELRLQLSEFCQPCSAWVGDRMTIEDMFPLDRLDDAVSAVCMGLVLRDGSTLYGSTRPAACR
jgi:hypothetical protein